MTGHLRPVSMWVVSHARLMCSTSHARLVYAGHVRLYIARVFLVARSYLLMLASVPSVIPTRLLALVVSCMVAKPLLMTACMCVMILRLLAALKLCH